MLAQTGRGGACSSRIRDTFQIRTHSVGANCVRPKFATDNGKAHSLKQANAKVLSHKATADILIHRL